MKPITCGLRLTPIPGKDFGSWPSDRSFKLLSEDARALRRRAAKGVGVELQRGLFVQVARRLDALALETTSLKAIELRGIEAEAWLELDALLSREDASVLTKSARSDRPIPKTFWQRLKGIFRYFGRRPRLRPPVLGEQVLFPGEEVAAWEDVLRTLRPARLCERSEAWRTLDQAAAAALLARAKGVFTAARREQGAVVQVLFDYVS